MLNYARALWARMTTYARSTIAHRVADRFIERHQYVGAVVLGIELIGVSAKLGQDAVARFYGAVVDDLKARDPVAFGNIFAAITQAR